MKKLAQTHAAEITLGIIVFLAVLVAYATLSLTGESPQLAAPPTPTPTPEDVYARLADMALRPEQLPAGSTWQSAERTYDSDPSQPLHNLDSDLPPESRAALLAYEAAYKVTAVVPNGFAGQYLYHYPSAEQAEQAKSLFTTILIESGRVLDVSEPAGDGELQGQTLTLRHTEVGNTFFFIGSTENVLVLLVVDGLDDGTTEETFRTLVAVLLQGQHHASAQPTATAEPTPAGTTIYYQAGRIFQATYADGVAQCVDSAPGSEVFGASPGGHRLLFRAGRNHAISLREGLLGAPQPVAEQVAWANWVDQDNFYFNTLGGEIYWTEITGEGLDTRFITKGAAPSALLS